ncbi:DUF6263 family protein [Ekhidna sp.]
MKAFTLILFLIISNGLVAQPFDLRLRTKKKQELEYSITTSLAITQFVDGVQSLTKMEIKNEISLEVKNIRNDKIEITSRYKKLSLDLEFEESAMSINSESTDERDTFSKILSQLVDKPFQLSISEKGEILEFSGLSKIIDGAFTDYKELPQAKIDQLKGQLNKAFGEEALKGNIQSFITIFPSNPVNEKDTWRIETSFNDGMSASIESDFILEDVRKNQAKIISTGIIESLDKEKYFELNGNYFKYNLVGTTDSDIVLDPETGQVIEAITHQDISGDSFLKPNDHIDEDVTISIEISNKTVITRLN